MPRRIVISVDGLSEEGRGRIRHVAESAGAVVAFIPEALGWTDQLGEAEAAFGLPPAAVVEASSLCFLQLHSSAYDSYKIPGLMGKSNLTIANARGVTARAVAEQCLAMMFALTRRIPFQLRNQLNHVWDRASTYEMLYNKTVTVIGMGAIGSALATMCHGIGMQVFSVQRRSKRYSFVDRVFPMAGLIEALRGSHHVALAMPTIPLAKPLIGAEEFAAMPDGSYVFNMSRAPLLDYSALVMALDSGKLAGAGLDVFPEEPLPAASPLWDREDVLIAPHSGGRFVGEMDALAELFAENLERYLSGEPIRNVVISKGTEVN